MILDAARAGRRRRAVLGAVRPVRPAEDQGHDRPEADPGGDGDRAVAAPAREPRPAGSARRPIACARASCRGAARTVRERLKSLNAEPVSLAGKGAVLEKGIVYVARLIERLELQAQPFRRRKPEELDRPARHLHPPHRRRRRGVRRRAARLQGRALARNFAAQLQRPGQGGVETEPGPVPQPPPPAAGPAHVHPRRRRDSQAAPRAARSSTARSTCARAWCCRIDLGGLGEAIVGYRAIKNSDVIDVNRLRGYADRGFLGADPRARGPAADPRSRPVLHSRLARESADPRRSRRRNGADRPGDRRVSRPLRRLLRSRLRAGRGRAAHRARGAGSAQPRRAVPARGRPAGRAPRLRKTRRRRRTSSMARTRPPTISTRVSSCRSTSGSRAGRLDGSAATLAQLMFRQVARSFTTNLSASVWASRLVAKLNIDVSRSRSVSKTSHRYRPGRFVSALTRTL